MLVGVGFLDQCLFAVAVFFAIEPVIHRREQHTRFDEITVLLQNAFEQRQRVFRFARRRINRRQVITRVLLSRTKLNRALLETGPLREFLQKRIPGRHHGTPDQVARLVAAVFSEDIPFLTGETIYIDGGQAVAN